MYYDMIPWGYRSIRLPFHRLTAFPFEPSSRPPQVLQSHHSPQPPKPPPPVRRVSQPHDPTCHAPRPLACPLSLQGDIHRRGDTRLDAPPAIPRHSLDITQAAQPLLA